MFILTKFSLANLFIAFFSNNPFHGKQSVIDILMNNLNKWIVYKLNKNHWVILFINNNFLWTRT